MQSVTCLTTDACEADCRSRVREFDPTIVEIDHEIISTVIPLPSTDSFKKGSCQLLEKVCAVVHEVLVNRLFKLAQEKSVVIWTDCPDMILS